MLSIVPEQLRHQAFLDYTVLVWGDDDLEPPRISLPQKVGPLARYRSQVIYNAHLI
jgi:hypothetical protein